MKFTSAPDHFVQAVSAVCQKGEQFLLIKRGKPSYQNWFAFPGGEIDSGETPVQAVARELKEETTITAQNFTHLVTIDLAKKSFSRPSYYLSVYQAHDFQGTAQAGDDAREAHWMNLSEMRQCLTVPCVLEIAEKMLSIGKSTTQQKAL